MNTEISYERLHELLNYDKETGIFTWKVDRGGAKIGAVAGTQAANGYIRIVVDLKSYPAHRLAWLFCYGYFPENEIDHKNHIRNDNQIDNLREVSRTCNIRNCKPVYKNSTSGIKGVNWDKSREKWQANIMLGGKATMLGRFSSKLLAAKARHEAEIKYDWSDCNTKRSSAYAYVKEAMDKYYDEQEAQEENQYA